MESSSDASPVSDRDLIRESEEEYSTPHSGARGTHMTLGAIAAGSPWRSEPAASPPYCPSRVATPLVLAEHTPRQAAERQLLEIARQGDLEEQEEQEERHARERGRVLRAHAMVEPTVAAPVSAEALRRCVRELEQQLRDAAAAAQAQLSRAEALALQVSRCHAAAAVHLSLGHHGGQWQTWRLWNPRTVRE
jgi:hypothetical protein